MARRFIWDLDDVDERREPDVVQSLGETLIEEKVVFLPEEEHEEADGCKGFLGDFTFAEDEDEAACFLAELVCTQRVDVGEENMAQNPLHRTRDNDDKDDQEEGQEDGQVFEKVICEHVITTDKKRKSSPLCSLESNDGRSKRLITDFFCRPNGSKVDISYGAARQEVKASSTRQRAKDMNSAMGARRKAEGKENEKAGDLRQQGERRAGVKWRGRFNKKPSANSSGWRKGNGPDEWQRIPGTSFLVDAFQHQSADCQHWFLTHFHSDHYAGLTKNFRHGTIYCSSVTAKLLILRLGLPEEKICCLPLDVKHSIDGTGVTLIDANHCPGAVMIMFEPSNGQAVLHTGDFRSSPSLLSSLRHCPPIHTLILDTTYCHPKYDFPPQDEAIRFVIDAIQAESFNSSALCLIGTYTIGKEKLFLEAARAVGKRVFVPALKRRTMECLGLSAEELDLLTTDPSSTNIHAVPLWALASFKRIQQTVSHYETRFSTIIAISPTGHVFEHCKKSQPGRRTQRGTIVR